MKRGALTAVVTLLFAAAAAAGVFLFMQNVRDSAVEVETVEVVVATRDIPAGEEFDPLIEEGAFASRAVARDDLVPGAITDVYQLQGQRSAYPILPGEQIPAARLAGPLQAGGGVLGIPEGLHAASVSLESQRSVAGHLQQGDHVEVFGTFSSKTGGSTTRVVIPDALVLAVADPTSTGGSGPNAVTLAVTPEQASLLIFTQEQGHVWLTLLPPNQVGVELPPANVRALW
jgi:Flp pilus assembly protein CpaB